MLYVVDPKALSQIVLKEQEVCDVSDFELQYVIHALYFRPRWPTSMYPFWRVIRFSFGPGLLGVTGTYIPHSGVIPHTNLLFVREWAQEATQDAGPGVFCRKREGDDTNLLQHRS